MSRNAAEDVAAATRRMSEATTPEELSRASTEWQDAQERALDRMGVERRQGGRVGLVMSAVLIVVLTISIALNLGLSISAHNTAIKVGELQTFTVENQQAGCERSNERNVSQVRNFRADRAKLEAERAFVKALLPGSVPALDAYLAAVDHDIGVKTRTIHEQIHSIAPFAVKPGSPETNCLKAYPLKPVSFTLPPALLTP